MPTNALGVLAAAVAVLAGGDIRPPPAAEGHAAAASAFPKAPALALPDPSGHVVELSRLRGRPVVVNFWASWCGPCRFEIPDLSAYWRANRDRCFELVGVAEDSGTPREVARAAKRFGIAYPVVVDAGGRAAERFGIVGLPQTIVIDAEGRIRRVFLGPVGKAELDEALAPLLAPRGTPCPRV